MIFREVFAKTDYLLSFLQMKYSVLAVIPRTLLTDYTVYICLLYTISLRCTLVCHLLMYMIHLPVKTDRLHYIPAVAAADAEIKVPSDENKEL